MTGSSATVAVAGDVIVVGGGAAGLTAALVLARARHRVTVLDDQTHRNGAVDEFHGFPTRDATAPTRFRADALAELHVYGVSIVRCAVTDARSTDTNVSLSLADGTSIQGDAIVIATGVHDELPTVEGLTARWGNRCSTARSATDGSIATSPSS
jgi:thioredoxin reductase